MGEEGCVYILRRTYPRPFQLVTVYPFLFCDICVSIIHRLYLVI